MPARLAIIQQTRNKCWWGCGEEGKLIPWDIHCSCLQSPRDGGTWWAAVYGVAQSWPRLKQLSSSSRVSYSFLVLNMINLRLKLSKCKVPTSPSYFHYPPLPRGDLELGQGCLTSHLLASLASFIPVASLALAHPAWPAICWCHHGPIRASSLEVPALILLGVQAEPRLFCCLVP